MPAPRRLAVLAAAGLLAALAGCQSPQQACRQAHPGDSAAYERCWQAALQQQNQELNRQDIREFRARGGG